MNVNLGKGFGPLDFDENGRMFSIFPENLPYVNDDFQGDDPDYCVYVDAELVEDVCNAGLDFEDFLRLDVEGRTQMLKEAGLDPTAYDLDFDHAVRERLEEEGLLDEYYGEDSEFGEEDEEDEYGYEEDEDFDDEEYFEDDDSSDDPLDDIDPDDFDDYDDEDEDDIPPDDEFFGDL
ncbi:MAG: hypothetical protein K6G06_06230 [Butyrivibrio sp.]|nr:hypothetical protein [Butyrivibrio sp.]